MRSAVATWILFLSCAFVADAQALNKRGERAKEPPVVASEEEIPAQNLTGYVFGGLFVWNPSYTARPNNTGIAFSRFGVHLDGDLWWRHLSLSYDESTFTDGLAETSSFALTPSEADHIVGVLSTWEPWAGWLVTGGLHYEADMPLVEARASYRAGRGNCDRSGGPVPCYLAGYTQQYVDATARLTYDPHSGVSAFVALGAFLWNPSFTARPDNSGRSLLRYDGHAEYALLPWLLLALDLNFFTDRDGPALRPSELDSVLGVQAHAGSLAVALIGEVDAPLYPYPTRGPHPPPSDRVGTQAYLSLQLQWSFDFHALLAHGPAQPDLEALPRGNLPVGR